MYHSDSFDNKGTLCQLRNVINRRNVSASADKDFHACDDFFNLVTRAHIIAASMKFFEMKSVNDVPKHSLITESLWTESSDFRKDVLEKVCKEIVIMFVKVRTFEESEESCSVVDERDKVLVYASRVLSLGLLYTEFSDSIREADGLRILRCWRYLMLIFKKAQRKNYAIKGLNLLAQYHFFLTPRQSEQLIWSRCVNTSGLPGKNIPSDPCLEHLNRVLKMAVGMYKTPESICRVSKSLGAIIDLGESFHTSLNIVKRSDKHAVSNSSKDFKMILKELLEADVFAHKHNRCHTSFKDLPIDSTYGLVKKDLDQWMKHHLQQLKEKIYYT